MVVNTGQPFTNVPVGLIKITGFAAPNYLVEQTNIDTETDLSGAFLFDGVPPGEYFMFYSLGRTQLWITNDTGRFMLIEVGPGQTVDLGLIVR